LRLRLQHLSKEFETPRGSVFAVEDIHFETAEHEFFVLLGPSGCGKSTLLNLIAGLEAPTGGEIWFDDRLVASAKSGVFLSPKERNIAMVFQSYALYPHMSIRDNIAFPLKISKEKDEHIREAVNRVAGMLGIAHLLSAKPGELSGGQRQRVAIGRAIVRHPAIFLLDEPLSNLDAQLRTSTRAELKSLQQQLGTTTIYVTHDQVEAMSLGHRIALLRDGRMEQIGTAEELYEKPANAFVARFIGSPPMNLLNSHLFMIDDALFIGIGGQEIGPINSEGLRAFAPGEYILGFRPEHISIQQGRKGGKTIRCESYSVDPLGREVLLQVRIDGQDAAVLTEDKRYAESRAGSQFDLVLDFSRVHLFESGGAQKTLFSP
jgi:multiple sugar transport system ATP-binding protein